MVLTKYKGDNCELSIGISNDANSTSQNYGMSLCLKDDAGVEYTLWVITVLGTIITGGFSKIIDTNKIKKNKFYLEKATTYNYTATIPLPEFEKEGKIYGQLGIYDGTDESSELKVGTTYDHAYNYEKKNSR